MQPETWVERKVVDLLAARGAGQAAEFLHSWADYRNGSWADAQREALKRSASGYHLPSARGQLRHIYGESAIRDAAQIAKVGCFPMLTKPAGGVFMVARIGRFALMNVNVRHEKFMPRDSLTRRLMSARNFEIDPQMGLGIPGQKAPPLITELAYFGCLIALPCKSDPTAPSELVLGVPDTGLTRWLLFMPFHRAHRLLLDRATSNPQPMIRLIEKSEIPDKAFSRFRIPKQDDTANDDSSEG